MGPKKKPAEDGEDISIDQFMKIYKRLCSEYGIAINKNVKERYETDYLENNEPITKFNMWDQLGWQGTKCLFNALETVKYQHTKTIRLWRTGSEDEGARSIVNYLKIAPNVMILEMLDCGITQLGCQFINKILVPDAKTNLIQLKLDHNTFGTEGLKYLADGLSRNKFMQNISLNYCDIDEDGARYIFEILIHTQSVIEDFSLNGNHLGNKGVIEVLRGVSIAKVLKKIYLSDNQFSEEDEVLDAIENCMKKNLNLGRYDFNHNFITDYGVQRIADILEYATHVYDVEVPIKISKEVYDNFEEKKKLNNKSKKGKKGKGKGKKKKS